MQVGQIPRPQESINRTHTTSSLKCFLKGTIKAGFKTVQKLSEGVEKAWSYYDTTSSLYGNALSIAGAFTAIPDKIEEVNEYLGVTSFIELPLSTWNLVKSGKKVIQAKTFEERCVSCVSFLMNTGSVISNVKSFISTLKTIGAISETAAPWASSLGFISLPLTTIGTGIQVYDLYKTEKFRREIKAHCNVPKEVKSLNGRVKNLKNGLQYAIDNEDKFKSKLQLSKNSPMVAKMSSLMKRLDSAKKEEKEAIVIEGEKLLKKLKTRACIQLGFKAASCALSVGIMGAQIASMVPQASAGAAPASAGLGIAKIGLKVIKSQVLLKDPFSDEKVWYEIAFDELKKLPKVLAITLSKVKATLKSFSQPQPLIA